MIEPEELLSRITNPKICPHLRDGLDLLFDNVEDAIEDSNFSYLNKLMTLAKTTEHLNPHMCVSIVRSCSRVKSRFPKVWAELVLHLQEKHPAVRRPTFDTLVTQATEIMKAG